MKPKYYRQGDVLIKSVNNIPNNLKKTKQCTLAYGEVTGHHHTIHNGAVGFAEREDDIVAFFTVTEEAGAGLTHQEHDTINLPAGNYQSIIQVEYTPEEIRNVVD